MKHTPGPWKLGGIGDTVITNAETPSSKDTFEYYGGQVIAESISSDNDRHLISAAPELLEACIKAHEVLEAILSFYGQSLQVHGWHLNGDAEPFDNFIDENMDGNEVELLYKAIQKARGDKE
ncbi:hypothetical protein M3175_01365 [Robertmurraya korlensis]|uniref:hypothetical protein n=1 Tax=Robertmurraya korlensis TaxID=519977 RepID=UPI00203B9C01|nr:hypothetical protein [Robertmurraya korlensis]MCM3599363.1 hypothetical protein [Robertmurraya korlensis]